MTDTKIQSFSLAEIVIKGRGTRIYHPPHRVLYNVTRLVLRIFGSDFISCSANHTYCRDVALLRLYEGCDIFMLIKRTSY